MDSIPHLPEEMWREILLRSHWIEIIENCTINKRIGLLTNKKSFWNLYTKQLFHHEFQKFLIYLSSNDYLELLIKILKTDTSRIDLLTFHSLWIRTLEYENRRKEASFIRELGIIKENKIDETFEYSFLEDTLAGLLTLKNVVSGYLRGLDITEACRSSDSCLDFIPSEYIGEYIIKTIGVSKIIDFEKFITQNTCDSRIKKLPGDILRYVSLKGDVESIKNFIRPTSPLYNIYKDIIVYNTSSSVMERLGVLFNAASSFIGIHNTDELFKQLTSSTEPNEDFFNFIGNTYLGAFPDFYFAKIDNIPLKYFSISIRLELYDVISVDFNHKGYTIASRIAKDRALDLSVKIPPL